MKGIENVYTEHKKVIVAQIFTFFAYKKRMSKRKDVNLTLLFRAVCLK